MKKKIASVFVALAMVFSMLPLGVSAEAAKWGDTVITTGNTFSNVTVHSPNEQTAEGFGLIDPGATITEMAAQVGDQYYATLQEAVDAAEAGQTVTLLRDIYLTAIVTVTSSDDIVLDLNGKHITVQKTDSRSLYSFDNYGVLTITDSSSSKEGSISARGILNQEGATLHIMGGTISAVDDGGGAAVWCYKNSTVNMSGGVLQATGGLTGTAGSYLAAGVIVAPESDPNVNINITGGTLKGKYKIITANYANQIHLSDCRVEIAGDPDVTDSALYFYGNQTNITMENVTIIGQNGAGGVQVNGGTASIRNCRISQTGIGNPAYVSCAVAASSGAKVTVEGGTYSGALASVYVYNSGGDVTLKSGDFVGNLKADNSTTETPSVIHVEDGSFTGGFSIGNQSTLSLTGGYFTSDPSAYVKNEYAALPSDDSAYSFMVGKQAESTVAAPATGKPVVDDSSLSTSMTEEDKQAASSAAESVAVPEGELSAAANKAVSQVTEQQKSAAENAIKAENSGVTVTDNDTVNIYAQTYLAITPVAYSNTQESKILTLEITPMYRVVASTADNAQNIKVVGETENGENPNAVVLKGSEKNLTGIQRMTITVELPANFLSNGASNVYVKHSRNGTLVGYHKATVTKDGEKQILSFTNDKGFSTFQVMEDSRSVSVTFGEGADATTLDPSNVGEAFPTQEAPNGKVFAGWQFTGVEGIYKSLTDELLTLLVKQSGTIAASPIFTETPAGGGTVSQPEQPEKPELPFTDVEPEDWFYEHVKYVYEKGLMAGTSATTFSPNIKLNRAMAVQVLYNLEGKPKAGKTTFTDASEAGEWALDAIGWAQENHIVSGYGDGMFQPRKNVSREEFAQMLYNYAEFKGVDVSAQESLDKFSDNDKVSSWAETALQWTTAMGIINGNDDGTLAPLGTTSRAHAAAILSNYHQK